MFNWMRFSALFAKERKDFAKNKNVLLMALMPLGFCLLYANLFLSDASMGAMGQWEVLSLCLGMSLVMMSGYSIGMMIAEEKEKMTLRTLLLSGVRPLEFFAGKAVLTILISIVVNIAMFFIVGLDPSFLLGYVLISTPMVIMMTILGGLLGVISPNQMATGVIGLPLMLLFLLIPSFANFNATFYKIAAFLPTQRMNLLMQDLLQNSLFNSSGDFMTHMFVIVVWFGISLFSFMFAYKKVGIDA